MTVSFIRFLIFSLLLVNATVAQKRGEKTRRQRTPRVTSATTATGRWYVFTSPDKDFVIEFPSKPQRLADDEAPSGTSRNYISVNHPTMFHFFYVDTGFDPGDRESNQLPPKFSQEMVEDAMRERKSTVLRSQLLHINIYELEVLTPRKGDKNLMIHSIERYVIRYGRQYTLACSSIVLNERVDAAMCQRYFDSFRVVGVPQPQ